MKTAVERAFVPFNARLEGVVYSMYTDILGLVTVGIGNLIDPVSYAQGLPFIRSDGTPATPAEIVEQWTRVKADPKGPKLGWRYTAQLSTIRLTPDGVQALVMAKARQNELVLVKRYPDFESWPADAQLALHSWAWACGPGGRWPALEKALLAKDFETASVEIHMNDAGADRIPNTPDDNWGLKPRNAANKQMMLNAALAMSEGGAFDPDTLMYPAAVDVPHPEMPEHHAAPAQTPVLPEELTGSGGIIHPRIDIEPLPVPDAY